MKIVKEKTYRCIRCGYVVDTEEEPFNNTPKNNSDYCSKCGNIIQIVSTRSAYKIGDKQWHQTRDRLR